MTASPAGVFDAPPAEVELLATERALAVFGGDHANLQPHSGAKANAAVHHAFLDPGDRVMALALDHGDHLTHGTKSNVSGRLYDVVAYGVRESDGLIDMDRVAAIAAEARPKLIVAGCSAYPRQLDFAAFAEIARSVGALLWVDMAHFAGLVAAGLHPSPAPHADVVSTAIHKTLGGARGGMIICRDEYAARIDSAVFAGQQGGPLEHEIADKAVALRIAASPEFRQRQRRSLFGAREIATELMRDERSLGVWSGGADIPLVVADLRRAALDGQQAEERLQRIGISANRNAVPFEPCPSTESSGVRIETAALATRGLGVPQFRRLGEVIRTALTGDFDREADRLAASCAEILAEFPLCPGVDCADAAKTGLESR